MYIQKLQQHNHYSHLINLPSYHLSKTCYTRSVNDIANQYENDNQYDTILAAPKPLDIETVDLIALVIPALLTCNVSISITYREIQKGPASLSDSIIQQGQLKYLFFTLAGGSLTQITFRAIQ